MIGEAHKCSRATQGNTAQLAPSRESLQSSAAAAVRPYGLHGRFLRIALAGVFPGLLVAVSSACEDSPAAAVPPPEIPQAVEDPAPTTDRPADASSSHPTSSPSTRTDAGAHPAASTGSPDVAADARLDAGSAVIAGDAGEGADSHAAPTALADDCDERYSLIAHGQAIPGDPTKYVVPARSEYYASFFFDAPWGAREVQLTRFHPIIDNKKIVHHWLLFGIDEGAEPDGMIQGDAEQLFPFAVPSEAPIHGWAPGAEDLNMPHDVGLRMPVGATASLRLEIHYYNTSNDDAEQDASGVELCVTGQKRTHEAAMHALGSVNILVPAGAKADVVNTCRPVIKDPPTHIMAVVPHMHRAGVHAKAVINRAGGERATLVDVPFQFGDQRTYPVPHDGSAPDVLLYPGDTITSTCSYANDTSDPISWGESTQAEMCFIYALAWPVGGLSNDSLAAVLFSSLYGYITPELLCIDEWE